MQSLIAIAVFVMLAGGVVFGISRYRNSGKLEQSRKLQLLTATIPPTIRTILASDQTTAHPITEFKPSVIEDPWESKLALAIAASTKEVMPD